MNKAFRECHIKIAAGYRDLENFNKVERHLRYAIKLDPRDPGAYSYLGDTLNNQKKFSAALDIYLSAIALSPTDQSLHISAADTLSNMKKPWEAFKMYEKALKLPSASAQDEVTALIGYVFSSKDVAFWKNSEIDTYKVIRNTIKILKKGIPSPISPYRMLFLPADNLLRYYIANSWSSRYVLEESNIYSNELSNSNNNNNNNRKRKMQTIKQSSIKTPEKNSDTDDQYANETLFPKSSSIRVGYLSRRFEDYPGTHLMLRLFQSHNRSRVTVHSFANGPDDGSIYRNFIKNESDYFHDIFRKSPHTSAQEIEANDIQILVDYGKS